VCVFINYVVLSEKEDKVKKKYSPQMCLCFTAKLPTFLLIICEYVYLNKILIQPKLLIH